MYKVSQLSPNANRSAMRAVVTRPGRSSTSDFANFQLWRSWLEFDSELDDKPAGAAINWNALLGLALTLAISAAFWSGVGVAVVQILK